MNTPVPFILRAAAVVYIQLPHRDSEMWSQRHRHVTNDYKEPTIERSYIITQTSAFLRESYWWGSYKNTSKDVKIEHINCSIISSVVCVLAVNNNLTFRNLKK